jgi:predicted metal-dependent hydrolase
MPSKPQIEPLRLHIQGTRVKVAIRVSRRARRIALKVDWRGEVSLTIPVRSSRQAALDFAQTQGSWLKERLAAVPSQVAFADGAKLPLLGRSAIIRHRPEARRGVWREGSVICVSGELENLPRRVTEWLRKEAKRELSERARAKALRIGRPILAVKVSDMASRWGSCSAAGAMSFSWRLILAPEPVIDYVVAHEVAHLKELNHGPRFWALVDKLAIDVEGSRAWLSRHGVELHRYG